MSLRLVFFSVTLFSSVASAATNQLLNEVAHTIRIGKGFNSLGDVSRSTNMSHCVQGSQINSLGGVSGPSTFIYVDSLTTRDKLTSSFADKNKQSGGTTKAVNAFSLRGELDVKLTREFEAESVTSYAVVHVQKVYQARSLDSYEILPETLGFFEDRPDKFFESCGDEFVSGVLAGSEVLALLACKSSTLQEKRVVDSKISAVGGYKGFDGKSEVSNVLTEVSKTSEDGCKLYAAAQGGNGSISTNVDKFVDSAVKFVQESSYEEARVLEIITTDYSKILNREFHDKILEQTDLELTAQKRYVSGLRNDIDKLTERLAVYFRVSGPSSQPYINTKAKIDDYESRIDHCIRNVYTPNACNTPLNLDPL